MSKLSNALVCVVHSESNTSLSFEVENLPLLLLTILSLINHLELAWFIDFKISSSVLVTEGMSSDDNWLFPTWNQSRNITDNNWLSEYCATKNISDGAVRALPHFLKAELLDSCLIWCDGSTLDADTTCSDGIGSINRDLIVCLVSMLNTQIKVLDVEVQEWCDKLIFDHLPDDSGHFITIEFSNWLLNLDLLRLHILRYYNWCT